MNALPSCVASPLLGVIERLADARDIDSILRPVRELFRQIIGCQGISLMMCQDGAISCLIQDAIASPGNVDHAPTLPDQDLRPVHDASHRQSHALQVHALGYALLGDVGLARMAIEQRRMVVIADIGTSLLIAPADRDASLLRSLIVMPLGSGAPSGALIAGWDQPHAAEGETLEVLARAVSRAIEATSLFASLVEATTIEVAHREAVERRLHDEIEDRGRTEARLAKAERIEAVGQLTSGVAHDFNNLLTVIIGNIEFLEATDPAGNTLDARSRRRLAAMREAAERGGNLTRQLLAFGRRQRLEPRPTDLNNTVAELRGLLPGAIGGGLTVETLLAPGLWPAFVDRTQIERMILNLALNAHDAMEVGGAITVQTCNRTVGVREADTLGLSGAGDFVEISVIDTGRGMTPDVLAHAFEPFFTTKPTGKGSGLGLAQVYGFARQSGGIVTLCSAPGQGTHASILLPRADAPPPSDRGIQASPAPTRSYSVANPPRRATSPSARLVLLVDDDVAVREVTSTIVAEAGYRVIEAASGQDALDRLRAIGPVDLMVTDYAMPGMNGFELARAAQAWQSGLKVLFVTGYADLTALQDVSESHILLKPFRGSKLIEKISTALQD